jgi:hypothetical protein
MPALLPAPGRRRVRPAAGRPRAGAPGARRAEAGRTARRQQATREMALHPRLRPGRAQRIERANTAGTVTSRTYRRNHGTRPVPRARISPPGGPVGSPRALSGSPVVPVGAAGATLTGRRPCGPRDAKDAVADGLPPPPGGGGAGRAGSAWSYARNVPPVGGSRAAGFSSAGASRCAGAIGSDPLGAPDRGEIGRAVAFATAAGENHFPLAGGSPQEPAPAVSGEFTSGGAR